MNLTMQDKELIEEAKKISAKSRQAKLIDTGCVGAALVTTKNNIFCGANLGFHCGMETCAENQAIGSMISNGEHEIKTIVAVQFNEKNIEYSVIPPCGKCREMIWQAGKKNQNSYVIISNTKKIRLKELLPYHKNYSIEK